MSPYSMYSYLYPEENKSFSYTVKELVYQLVPRLIMHMIEYTNYADQAIEDPRCSTFFFVNQLLALLN